MATSFEYSENPKKYSLRNFVNPKYSYDTSSDTSSVRKTIIYIHSNIHLSVQKSMHPILLRILRVPEKVFGGHSGGELEYPKKYLTDTFLDTLHIQDVRDLQVRMEH